MQQTISSAKSKNAFLEPFRLKGMKIIGVLTLITMLLAGKSLVTMLFIACVGVAGTVILLHRLPKWFQNKVFGNKSLRLITDVGLSSAAMYMAIANKSGMTVIGAMLVAAFLFSFLLEANAK